MNKKLIQKKIMYPFLLIIILLSISITPVHAASVQNDNVKLRMVILPYLSFAPFFIAQEEGFFQEQGLDVEFVKLSEGMGALPLLIQGKLDVATGTIGINMMNAIARGGTVKIVADKGHINPKGCPVNGILIRRGLINDSSDIVDQLRGKKISLNPISTDGYYVEKAFTKIGLTMDDLQIKGFLIPPMRAQALKSGSVDIVHVSEPWVTRILREGHSTLWVSAKDVVPNFQYAVIVFGPNLLNKNRKAGQRFMIAYLNAMRQYNKGKTDRNVEILSKYSGVERELLLEACWPALDSKGQIDVNSVLDFQKWAMEKGLLDRLIKENQFWDPSFVEHANQVLGKALK